MHPLSRRVQAAAPPTAFTTSLPYTGALPQGAHAAFADFVDAARTPLSAVVMAAGMQDA